MARHLGIEVVLQVERERAEETGNKVTPRGPGSKMWLRTFGSMRKPYSEDGIPPSGDHHDDRIAEYCRCPRQGEESGDKGSRKRQPFDDKPGAFGGPFAVGPQPEPRKEYGSAEEGSPEREMSRFAFQIGMIWKDLMMVEVGGAVSVA